MRDTLGYESARALKRLERWEHVERMDRCAREMERRERRMAKRRADYIAARLYDTPYSALVREDGIETDAPSRAATEGIEGYMGLDHLRRITMGISRKPSRADIYDMPGLLPRSAHTAEMIERELQAQAQRGELLHAYALAMPCGIPADELQAIIEAELSDSGD